MSDLRTPADGPDLGRRVRRGLGRIAIALVAACMVPAGCESKERRLESLYLLAGTSAAKAATDAATEYSAGAITIQDLLGLAHDRVETRGDANSVAFAAVVLDLCAKNEAKLLGNPSVNEFLWMRIGTLAGNSAARARALGDRGAARALVLGGPARWQSETYWNQNPEHDALASIILFEAGLTQEALNRLSARTDISEPARQAQEYIRSQMALQQQQREQKRPSPGPARRP